MSTRAAIRILDNRYEQWYYCHSPGYPINNNSDNPTGILPDLIKMREWVQQGTIRDNVKQASGWLVRLGVAALIEQQQAERVQGPDEPEILLSQPPGPKTAMNWKASLYEPCSMSEALLDYDWAYWLDLRKPSIAIFSRKNTNARGITVQRRLEM